MLVLMSQCKPAFKGPKLQPDLRHVLIRFRCHQVGIMTDIKKMFLQIKLNCQDQSSHRFLWRDLHTHQEPEIYCMTRVTLNSQILAQTLPKTKRSLISLYSRVFDPMGLLTPFLIPKLLFQELWTCGLDWGQPLDADSQTLGRPGNMN